MITDGVTSYAVFTYRCGDMNWAYGPTIGFNAAGDYYVNHPNTGSTSGEEIACLNSPASQWYNLVYEISLPNATNLTAELPTVEPRKSLLFSNSKYEVYVLCFTYSSKQVFIIFGVHKQHIDLRHTTSLSELYRCDHYSRKWISVWFLLPFNCLCKIEFS